MVAVHGVHHFNQGVILEHRVQALRVVAQRVGVQGADGIRVGVVPDEQRLVVVHAVRRAADHANVVTSVLQRCLGVMGSRVVGAQGFHITGLGVPQDAAIREEPGTAAADSTVHAVRHREAGQVAVRVGAIHHVDLLVDACTPVPDELTVRSDHHGLPRVQREHRIFVLGDNLEGLAAALEDQRRVVAIRREADQVLAVVGDAPSAAGKRECRISQISQRGGRRTDVQGADHAAGVVEQDRITGVEPVVMRRDQIGHRVGGQIHRVHGAGARHDEVPRVVGHVAAAVDLAGQRGVDQQVLVLLVSQPDRVDRDFGVRGVAGQGGAVGGRDHRIQRDQVPIHQLVREAIVHTDIQLRQIHRHGAGEQVRDAGPDQACNRGRLGRRLDQHVGRSQIHVGDLDVGDSRSGATTAGTTTAGTAGSGIGGRPVTTTATATGRQSSDSRDDDREMEQTLHDHSPEGSPLLWLLRGRRSGGLELSGFV